MVNLPTRIWDCDSDSSAFLGLFISSDASICSIVPFCPLGNLDHAVVSVSIDFLWNTKSDDPLHCRAFNYSCSDWDNLCDHLRNVPWQDIFDDDDDDNDDDKDELFLSYGWPTKGI